MEATLRNIFPNRTNEQIANIIAIVEEQIPAVSEEEKIEFATALLEGPAAEGPYFEEDLLFDDEEGAVGYQDALGWEVVLDRLKGMFPNASPTYLEEKAKSLAPQGEVHIQQFIDNALENHDYPTLEDYNSKKKEDDMLLLYKTVPFDYDRFLEIFPDPEGAFNDTCRPNPLLDESTSEDDILYATTFLYNSFPLLRTRDINLALKMKRSHLINCFNFLKHLSKGLQVPREPIPLPDCRNLPLLQEVTYLKNKKILEKYVIYKDRTYRQFFEEARKLNLVQSCLICYTDLIPEEFYPCKKDCIFCKDCICKFVEEKMAEASTKFPCPNQCDSELSMRVVQGAISPHVFELLLMKIQSAELKLAKLDDVETCPFCDYTNVVVKDSTIFACKNEECMKQSCRLCRHESHIPKRCNEIEYDEDVRMRTFIENKMTEALTRTCPKCHKTFLKEGGCNKMTCPCGALMCYLCGQQVQGYNHFSATGCPLFVNDAEFDLKRIRDWAEQAKTELGNPNIKFDPTKGIEQFYKT